MTPPQKRFWGVKLETVGACHVAPTLRSSWHVSEGQEWKKHNAPPQRGVQICYFFCMKVRVWTCGSSGWSYAFDKCQLSGGVFSNGTTSEGGFEIQMGVDPEGMESGHVAPPQSGSYGAMWQWGRKMRERDTWRLHRPDGKGRIQDLRHLDLVWNFWMVCFFWRRPRVTCVFYFSEKK